MSRGKQFIYVSQEIYCLGFCLTGNQIIIQFHTFFSVFLKLDLGPYFGHRHLTAQKRPDCAEGQQWSPLAALPTPHISGYGISRVSDG